TDVSGPLQMGGGPGTAPNLRMLSTNQFAPCVVMSLTSRQTPHSPYTTHFRAQTLAGINSPSQFLVIQNEKLGGGGTSQAATLTLNGSGTYSFAGYLRDEDDGGNNFKLNLAKTGSGTQSLVGGSIYYTGTTAVT